MVSGFANLELECVAVCVCVLVKSEVGKALKHAFYESLVPYFFLNHCEFINMS